MPYGMRHIAMQLEALVVMRAQVTAHARAKIQDVFAREGVTLGSVLEAYAEEVDNEHGLPITDDTVFRRAREISADRRRRDGHDAERSQSDSASPPVFR